MTQRTAPARPLQAAGPEGDGLGELLARYGCGPVKFTGTDDALYERHLVFDHVIDPKDAGPREQFEAVAARMRDVLSQRWVGPSSSTTGPTPSRSTTSRWSS